MARSPEHQVRDGRMGTSDYDATLSVYNWLSYDAEKSGGAKQGVLSLDHQSKVG